VASRPIPILWEPPYVVNVLSPELDQVVEPQSMPAASDEVVVDNALKSSFADLNHPDPEALPITTIFSFYAEAHKTAGFDQPAYTWTWRNE
jgi:hypothetical protein